MLQIKTTSNSTNNSNSTNSTTTIVPEDDSCCADANPLVNKDDALLVLLLNIFIPGIGTMIAAYRSVDGFNCKACGNGIGQMILTVVIAGSIWSII